MLSPDGVYMINIIDVYESDAVAEAKAESKAKDDDVTRPATLEALKRQELARARKYGGFLGAWVKTAKLTFPHIYVYGTDADAGAGLRETFVVVASKKPLDLEELGLRDDDPKFSTSSKESQPQGYEAYGAKDLEAIDLRSRGIILTDDYAPVENLLAPVAATRGDD